MQRFGRISKLRPAAVAAYDRWHAAVWPDVSAAIAEAGLHNFSIFRHDAWLFAYCELRVGVTMAQVAAVMDQSVACRRWEELMRVLRDPAFAVDWLPMKEVFHLDPKDHARPRAATGAYHALAGAATGVRLGV